MLIHCSDNKEERVKQENESQKKEWLQRSKKEKNLTKKRK